jgi:hypothetical protein
VAADKPLAGRAALDKLVHLGDRAVKHGHAEPAAFHVESEVFAHHCQTDQAEIAQLAHIVAPVLLDPVHCSRNGRQSLNRGV